MTRSDKTFLCHFSTHLRDYVLINPVLFVQTILSKKLKNIHSKYIKGITLIFFFFFNLTLDSYDFGCFFTPLALVPDHSVAFFAVVCYSNWPKSSAGKSATIQEFP